MKKVWMFEKHCELKPNLAHSVPQFTVWFLISIFEINVCLSFDAELKNYRIRNLKIMSKLLFKIALLPKNARQT